MDKPRADTPDPTTDAAVRAALHRLIDRLTAEAALTLWRFLATWERPEPDPSPAEPER